MLLDDKRGPREPGLLGKSLALIGGLALLILGFMFSLMLLAVAAVLVAGIWAYLWWKTRDLRRRLREQGAAPPRESPPGGRIFDGEAVHVDGADTHDADPRG